MRFTGYYLQWCNDEFQHPGARFNDHILSSWSNVEVHLMGIAQIVAMCNDVY